jgi:hypothetical protein
MEIYYDDDELEHFMIASSSGPTVWEQKESNRTDYGSAIRGYYKSKKEMFGDYRTFKELKELFINLTNVSGTVHVRVEVSDRDDKVSSVKTATITKSSISDGVGFGFDLFGTVQWGQTNGSGVQQQISDIIRWLQVNSLGRYFQIEVESTDTSTTWELSGIAMRARELSHSFLNSNTMV